MILLLFGGSVDCSGGSVAGVARVGNLSDSFLGIEVVVRRVPSAEAFIFFNSLDTV